MFSLTILRTFSKYTFVWLFGSFLAPGRVDQPQWVTNISCILGRLRFSCSCVLKKDLSGLFSKSSNSKSESIDCWSVRTGTINESTACQDKCVAPEKKGEVYINTFSTSILLNSLSNRSFMELRICDRALIDSPGIPLAWERADSIIDGNSYKLGEEGTK